MNRAILFLLAAVLLLTCALSGCAQRKNVVVGADGIVSSEDSAAQTPATSAAPDDSSAETPEPTPAPTPTDASGWSYRYDRELVNQSNVIFTLQTIEYDSATHTLRVVADYANTGTYEQLIANIYALVVNEYYSLAVEPAATENAPIYLQGGETRTLSFSYTFTSDELAHLNMEQVKSVDIQVYKMEATDRAHPDNFDLESFTWVTVELPPAA